MDRKRAIVVAVQLPNVTDREFQASIAELGQLAKTLGFSVVRTFTQQRSRFDPGAYLGTGKRQEMRRFVRGEADADPAAQAGTSADPDGPASVQDEAAGAAHEDADRSAKSSRRARQQDRAAPQRARERIESATDEDAAAEVAERNAELILIDHEISPSQARNLEKEVGCEVMDRTMVILEIFHRHARSRAARAQVEIVRLGYMAPRLREAAKLAGPQGRQRSGVGGRGAGESRGELDRRKIRDRIAELQEELVQLDAERKTQRERRQARQGLARAALVGYTNAGKSTLMRALTGSEVLVADKLFATLDTTVRALHPETVPRILISDTVGFIKNLPHGLVASFKSTLDEALEAGLLIHVIDAADPEFERQRQVTESVLDEIGAHEVPRLLVFNKIDRVGDAAEEQNAEALLRAQYPECVVMSARRPQDVTALRARIAAFFQSTLVETELFLPWSAQPLRGEIFKVCEVLEERTRDDGTVLHVRGEADALARIRRRLGANAKPDADPRTSTELG